MRKLAILLTALLLAAGYARSQSTVSGTASISVAVLGLTPSPTSLTFPSTVQGLTSASQPVTLLNTGGGPVSIQSIAASAQYGQTNNCPGILQPNVSCVINVTFSPTGTGTINGTLTMTDNAPDSPEIVTLSGTATASGGGTAPGCGGAGQLPCTLGWFQIPSTLPSTACPPAGSYSDIQGGQGCPAVITSWGGGWADTTRNRLMYWGGGHADYFGNELYSLNLTANPITLTRLNEPTRNPNTSCGGGAYQDGKPCSRHSYDYLAYSPTADQMVNFGGSLPPGGSFCAEDIWELNSSSLAWTSRGSGNWDCNSVYVGSAYDPNSNLIFFADDHNIFSYNTTTHAMTNVGGAYTARNTLAYSSVVIDPVHKFLFVMGGSGGGGTGGNLYRFNIANPASVPAPTDQYAAANAAGCSAWTGASSPGGPGVTWYGPRNAIALWSGGNDLGLYDPVANSCSTVTFSGGPGSAQTHGTFGRFSYIPQMGVFALVNAPNQNAYALRIDTAADTNFVNRATQPGVLNVQSFDTITTATQVNSASFTDGFSGSGNQANNVHDTATFLSGGASMKFHIPAGSYSGDMNCCQNYYGFFGQGANNVRFGQNSTFYVQYAFRADPVWATPQFNTDSGTTWPKLVIFHSVLPSQLGVPGSCAAMEITTIDTHSLTGPSTYGECGVNQIVTGADGITWNNNGQMIQQGFTEPAPFTGYQCTYNNNAITGNCFKILANTWYTFYYKISIGTWGSNNSTIEAWVAPYGQQMKKWINVHNFKINNDSPGNCNGLNPCPPFNVLELTQFFTNRSGSNANADVWYDELIISNQPIPAPAGVSP